MAELCSSNTTKNFHVSFSPELLDSEEENERTARGFRSRKEKRKMAEQERLKGAVGDIGLRLNTSKLLETGDEGSAMKFCLASFLLTMGAPDELNTKEKLEWFHDNYEPPTLKQVKQQQDDALGFLDAVSTEITRMHLRTDSAFLLRNPNQKGWQCCLTPCHKFQDNLARLLMTTWYQTLLSASSLRRASKSAH
jgi:hypothetical protein